MNDSRIGSVLKRLEESGPPEDGRSSRDSMSAVDRHPATRLPDMLVPSNAPQRRTGLLNMLEEVDGYNSLNRVTDAWKMAKANVAVRDAVLAHHVDLKIREVEHHHALEVEKQTDHFQIRMAEVAARSHASANRLGQNIEAQRYIDEEKIFDARNGYLEDLAQRFEAGRYTEQEFLRLANKIKRRSLLQEEGNDLMADEILERVHQQVRRGPANKR